MNGERVFDAIIVGGGVAGMTAARELAAKDRKVLLLEARDRLGGRLHSKPFCGRGPVVEIGGAYFKPVPGSYVSNEVERYGLVLAPPIKSTDVKWLLVGTMYSSSEFIEEHGAEIEAAAFQIISDAKRFVPGVPTAEQPVPDLDIAASDYLDSLNLSKPVKDFFEAWATQYSGTTLDEISAVSAIGLVFSRGNSIINLVSTNAYVFEQGTSQLINAIAAGLGDVDIRFRSVVSSISQKDDGVTIELSTGQTFRGRSAICAVPVNTLSAIQFEPPLRPEQAEYVSKGQPCRGVKLCVSITGIEEPILRAGMGGPLQLLQTVHKDKDHHLVVGFGIEKGGPDLSSPESITAAVKHLAPEAQILQIEAHDWNQDPYASGAWATFRPGEMKDALVMRAPHRRVHFIGADLSDTRGVEGALKMAFDVAELLEAH